MADNEEPDEELPFPRYDHLPEVYLSSKMLLENYNALHDYSRSLIGKNKFLHKRTRELSQEVSLVTAKYEALQDSIENKRTTDALTNILTAVTTVVIGIGVTVALTLPGQMNIGIGFIIFGLIIACCTALSFLRSGKKRRGDSE